MEDALTFEISEELYREIEERVQKQGLTMEEFLLGAVKKKLEE